MNYICFSSLLLLLFHNKCEISDFASDSNRSTKNTSTVFGLHIDTLHAKRDFLAGNQRPLLLKNVFQWENKNWIEDILNKLKDLQIEYDVRESYSSILNTYEAKLEDFLSTLEDNSDHSDSMYLMNEDILQVIPLPADHFFLNQTIFGKDFFNLFPMRIKPKVALIIGGRGSRSFLHADPYEWTGWNHLVKGRKLWTFLPSGKSIEKVLGDVTRNPPDAWDSARYNLSAGWVSNVDLYRLKVRESISTDVLMDLEERNKVLNLPDDAHQLLKRSMLNKKWMKGLRQRNIFKQNYSAEDNVRRIEKKLFSMPNSKIPAFLSGHKQLDFCEDSDIAGEAVQIVQEEGELILIPPGMWHQVYHLEPSVAIAGQYMNTDNEMGIYNHILSWCTHDNEECSVDKQEGIATYLSSESFLNLKPKDRIAAVIRRGLRLQHGKRTGEVLFKELYQNKEKTKIEREKEF